MSLKLRVLIASCVFLIICSLRISSAPVTNDQKKIYLDEQLRLADGLMQRKHYALAIEEYQRLIRRFPNDELAAEAWSQLAEAFAAAGNIPQSIITYNHFFRKFPNVRTSDASKINYAKILCKTGDPKNKDMGISILLNIKNMNDKSELLRDAATYYLAKIYYDSGEKIKADSEFKLLADKKITSKDQIFRALARLELAMTFKEEKKNNDALEILKSLTENKNTAPEVLDTALQVTAAIYCEQKQFLQASETYKQLFILLPETKSGKEALYKQLECLLFAKEYANLIRESDNYLRNFQNNDLDINRLFFLKAYALQQQKSFKSALELFLKILDSREKDSDFFQKAAYQSIECLIAEKKLKKAYDTAQKFISNPHISADIRIDIVSLIISNTEKLEDSIRFLVIAISKCKNKKLKNNLLLKLADQQLESDQVENAIANYRIVSATANKKLRPYGLMGAASCLRKLGKNKDALAAYETIIKDFSDSESLPEALLQSALIMLNDNNNPVIAQKYLLAIKKNFRTHPLCRYALFYLGYLNFYGENWENAEADFMELLQGKNSDPALAANAKLYLGWTYLKSDRKKESLEIFNNLIKTPQVIEMASPELLTLLGKIFLESNNPDAAMTCYNILLKSPDKIHNQQALLGLSFVEKQHGNAEKTVSYLREAIKLEADPETTCEACAYLGETLAAHGNKSEALLFFEKCLESPADRNASARARLGVARILSEEKDRLQTANRYAMSVFILCNDPEISSEAMLLSMDLSLRMGKYSEAQSTWLELEKRFPEIAKGETAKAMAAKLKGGK